VRVRGHSHEAPPADGAAALERFEARDVDELLGFLVRRTGDAQLAADVTAETFAAALIAHHRSGPDDAPSAASLRRIALERLADAQRRGFVDTSARRRLGMTRIELAADEIVRIEARGEGRAATLWAGHPAPEAAEAPDAVVAGGVGARPDFATRLLAQLGEAAPRAERERLREAIERHPEMAGCSS
jgi:DNA-directed RNA polymerase specialized sigma24 family protein